MRRIFTFLLFVPLFCLPSLLYAQVVANFIASPTSGCTPLIVSFTNTSVGFIDSVLWTFGNGSVSNDMNPSVIYTVPGTYTVTLTVCNSALGICDTDTRTSLITVFANPMADFTANSVSGCLPLTVNFSDVSTLGDAPIATWEWDFGDGVVQGPGSFSTTFHTYVIPGIYDVTLVVVDQNGCESTMIIDSLVSVSIPPTVSFGGTPRLGCDFPHDVSFTSNVNPPGVYTYLWDFGDGGASTQANPTYTYTMDGNFPVNLTVTDTSGCAVSTNLNNYVQIQDIPMADFSVVNSTVCLGEPINFVNTSSGASFYLWDFGDGLISTNANPSHTYGVSGTYDVTLIATASASFGGCQDTIVQTVTVNINTNPLADFTATPMGPIQSCQVPFTMDFFDASIGATNWLWDFGDGNTSNVQNPVHTYTATGDYTVSLTVADAAGCSDNEIRPFYVQISELHADFTAFPIREGCIPLTVNFQDLSQVTGDSIDLWIWDFGDGTTSLVQNPTHTYTQQGKYDVTLVIRTVSGCRDTITIDEYIMAGTPPIIDWIQFDPDHTYCVSENVCLTPLVFPVPTNSCTTTDVNFGGPGASATTPIHGQTCFQYSDTGVYDVTMIVDNYGCSDTLTRTGDVTILLPTAEFTMNPNPACGTPATIQFIDQSITPDSWLWDFGDGHTSTQQNPTHTYTNDGVYTVLLTVDNSSTTGCVDTTAHTLIIGNPIANFDGVPTFGCAPHTVSFNNLSQRADTYFWNFGDGTTSTASNPTHVYLTGGTYSVSLTVTDANGCVDSIIRSNYVTVSSPTIGFGASPTQDTCPPLIVSFTDSSSSDVISWDWDFGDGTSSSLQNPQHLYGVAGEYDVCLEIENAQGCRDTLCENSFVNLAGPRGSFTFTPTEGCSPLEVFFQSTTQGAVSGTWHFGDGTIGLGSSTTHTYFLDTIAVPTFIIEDTAECEVVVTSSDSIQIYPLPNPGFVADFPAVCLGDAITFTNTSSAPADHPITAYHWDFGDGDTSNLENPPPHFYTTPGNYTVTLTVFTVDGCVDSSATPLHIVVYPPPVAQIGVAQGCEPFRVQFTDESTGISPIVDWAWDFGDGTISFSANPSHVYTSPGIYDVTLVVTDTLGCKDTLTLDSLLEICSPPPLFTCDSLLNCSIGNLGDVDISNVDVGEVLIWDGLMFTAGEVDANDADADPSNELQDLTQIGNSIGLSQSSTSIDLSLYLDNTDEQTLSWDSASGSLSIMNGNSVMLTGLGGSGAGGNSIWSLNGNDAYYNSGNVGIGTDTPDAKVKIVGNSLGTQAVLQIEGNDDLAPNGYSLEVKGHPSGGGNGHHTQVTTASADSRFTLKAGADTDFAPRLQMTGAGEVSSAGWAIFDYGSYLVDLPDASFKMRFIPQSGFPIDMIQAEGEEGVYLAPSAGMVGIGTRTPEALLHVAGEIRSDALVGGGNVIADIDGNLVLGTAVQGDTDPSNELISTFTVSGSLLEIVEAGVSHTVDLAALIGSIGSDNDWGFVGGDSLSSPIYHIGEVGIGTSTPIAKLEVQSGAVLFHGTTGATPLSGAGTRMMWIPEKAALRAGTVMGTQWDDANIGLYSTAFGLSSQATADGSTAIGRNNEALGEGATALGFGTRASGLASTAMGASAKATGDFSFAVGAVSKASGVYSVAMGGETTASGNYATAMGQSSEALGNNSTAMGMGTQTSFASLAIGQYNQDMGSDIAWDVNDYVFTIGDGFNNDTRSNTMYVKKNGDMWIQGGLTQYSDRRLKRNFEPLQDVMRKIRLLNGVSYQWKDIEMMGQERELGLIAQELEKVYPELVEEVEGYKAVNYIGLIPVLIEGLKAQDKRMISQEEKLIVQEELLLNQQETIDNLQAELGEIKQMLAFLGLGDEVEGANLADTEADENQAIESRLYQNKPNPFDDKTDLPYFLAKGSLSPEIVVSELLSGKVIGRYPIEGYGYGRIQLSAGDIPAGVYIYSLYVQGVEVDSRRMVLVD